MKRYRVTLTSEEREELGRLLARGKADVRKLKHAQVLLKADEAEAGPGWVDERIAEALEVGLATVQRLRRRFVEGGLGGSAEPLSWRQADLHDQARRGAGGASDRAGLLHSPRRADAMDAAAPGWADG